MIGGTTKARREAKAAAEQVYYALMLKEGRVAHGLDTEKPAITFDAFAQWYDAHVIQHHKGKEREREILVRLRRDFGALRLRDIDQAVVKAWRTQRLQTSTETIVRTRAKGAATWRRVHALLTQRGPLALADIKAALLLTEETRYIARAFLTRETMPFFKREARGVWAAVGTLDAPKRRVIPPPSHRTVNREVDLLQQILVAAVPKYLTVSPLVGLSDLPTSEPVRRTMSVAEEQALLGELGAVDRAILIAGLDSLLRLGDILDLQRADDHGDTLVIRDTKNRRGHTVPISSRLRAALDAVPVDERHPDWYFPSRRRAKTERDRRGAVASVLRQACERAGLPYGRAIQGITFHWATRRTGATRMIRAGGEKAIGTTQRIGNWKDPRVLIGIYQETITADMQAAVETVASAIDPIPTHGLRPTAARKKQSR